MHTNSRLTAHVSVIREDGGVLYSKLATRSWDFGVDADEARRFGDRCARWLEAMPSPDFDPSVFTRREVGADDLLRILDSMLRPERRGTIYDSEAVAT